MNYRDLNKITPSTWTEDKNGEAITIIDGVKIFAVGYTDVILFCVYRNGIAKTAIVQQTKPSINSAIKRLSKKADRII
jgi:hypothetical protein